MSNEERAEALLLETLAEELAGLAERKKLAHRKKLATAINKLLLEHRVSEGIDAGSVVFHEGGGV